MIDIPYTIEDEPADHWKVEDVLKWWLLRANAESEAEYNTIVEGMSKQLEEGQKELWEAHEQVLEIVRESENVENQSVQSNSNNKNQKSVAPNKNKRQPPEKPEPKPTAKVVAASTRPARTKKPTARAAAAAAVTTAIAPSGNDKPDTIHIDITAGPYDGQFYDLQPKTRSHSWVGRSSSAKFKDRGISLPLDLEVSTSHGRFEFKQGKFYFMDVASTNGSRINGEECIPNQPYELKAKGVTLLVGQTTMKVTLLKLS